MTAMEMPLINFQKTAEKAAKREADRETEDGSPAIQATDEYATFNGYKARKFITTMRNGSTIHPVGEPGCTLIARR